MMLKFQIFLIAILISCLAFMSCERVQNIVAPATPDEDTMVPGDMMKPGETTEPTGMTDTTDTTEPTGMTDTTDMTEPTGMTDMPDMDDSSMAGLLSLLTN